MQCKPHLLVNIIVCISFSLWGKQNQFRSAQEQEVTSDMEMLLQEEILQNVD